jgi:hypothetical protein
MPIGLVAAQAGDQDHGPGRVVSGYPPRREAQPVGAPEAHLAVARDPRRRGFAPAAGGWRRRAASPRTARLPRYPTVRIARTSKIQSASFTASPPVLRPTSRHAGRDHPLRIRPDRRESIHCVGSLFLARVRLGLLLWSILTQGGEDRGHRLARLVVAGSGPRETRSLSRPRRVPIRPRLPGCPQRRRSAPKRNRPAATSASVRASLLYFLSSCSSERWLITNRPPGSAGAPIRPSC